jgi:uncharacterized membrane protein HdeD (DUF308 family)
MNTTILGAVCMIFGILAMLMPGLVGMSIAMILGILVLASGIVRIIWSFQAGSFGKGILKFVIGGLTLLCGIALLANPLFASGVLTILLTVYFILDGIVEIAAGAQIGTINGGGWLFFAGAISILLGLMIWSQFPLSGAWALGILLGIKLFLVGLIMATAGSTARSMAKE